MYNQTPPTDNQDAFNRVWKFFVVEGHGRSLSRDEGCSYRGEEKGQACAIGCMMPSKMARRADVPRDCEGTDIKTIIHRLPSAKKWFSNVSEKLLVELQAAHDEGHFNSDKNRLLIAVARRHNLEVPKS